MTKVKLCGLRTVEDILCVNEVKADLAGVIFTERFKRHVDEDTARKMKAALSPDIPLTGVFVDEPVTRIERLVRDGVIDYAQLHGSASSPTVLLTATWRCISLTSTFPAIQNACCCIENWMAFRQTNSWQLIVPD